MFWDGISYIHDETLIPLYLGRHCLICGNGIPQEGEDDCWLGEAVVLHFTTPYTPVKV